MFFVDENSLGQTIQLPVGQVVELRLKENPTTGFRWKFVDDGSPCFIIVSDDFQRPEGGAPGAGGEHAWQMQAIHAGACELRLSYLRSFDPDAPPAQSFTLHVNVTE